MDMNLNDAPLGYAFEGDYPESYGDLTPRLQEVLARQLTELGSADRETEILGILRGRRCGRKDLPQLDVRRRRDGSPYLVARGEIVMPPNLYVSRAVQHVLRNRGFNDHKWRGELVRVRRFAASVGGVEQTLDEVGMRGGSGWPNYLATMAAVGKGMGGAEPVPGLGGFADYRIPSAPEYGEEPPPRVAVIDTGIPSLDRGDGSPNMNRSDGWLDGVDRDDDNRDLLDILPAGMDGYLDFQAGHGTFVAGIIQRVAPGADIRVYRAADTDGLARDDGIAYAMLRAVDDGAQILNLSLGGLTAHDEPPYAIAQAVERIRTQSKRAVVIVAAAGNNGDDTPYWPAALTGVEAVAGLTAELTGSTWSSRGDHVRFSTVAEGIRSTFVTGHESPEFDREPEVFGENAWAIWSGTSFAAPQIAGAVARICQEQHMTPPEAVDVLDERGKPIDQFGKAMRIFEGLG